MGADNNRDAFDEMDNDFVNGAMGAANMARQTSDLIKSNSQNANRENMQNNSALKAEKNSANTGKNAQNAGKNVQNAADKGQSITGDAEHAKEAAEKADQAIKAGQKAKEGAELAKDAAAAGATGGTSLIAKAIIGAIKGTSSAISGLTTGEDQDAGLIGNVIKYIVVAIILFFLFTTMACYYLVSIASSQLENYQEVEYKNHEMTGGPSERNASYTSNDSSQITSVIDNDHPFAGASKESKEAIELAMEDAFRKEAITLVKSMKSTTLAKLKDRITALFTDGFYYNEEKTLEYFYNNPYPYCLKIDEFDYYTIGDYLYTIGGYSEKKFNEMSHREIPEDFMNNDLNFAELIAIISQGERFSTLNGTYKDYKDMFTLPDNQIMLFEMTVEGIDDIEGPFWYGGTTTIYTEQEDSYDEINLDDGYKEILLDSNNNNNSSSKNLVETEVAIEDTQDKNDPRFENSKNKYYYLKPVVKPFGLRELYRIAGCDSELAEDNEQPGNQVSLNHPADDFGYSDGIMNFEMLDLTEKYDRVYCRMGDLGNVGVEEGENYLGPSCLEERSKLSLIYGEEHTIDGKPLTTGRSANYYIPKENLINAGDLRAIRNGDWIEGGDNILIDPSMDAYEDVTGSGELVPINGSVMKYPEPGVDKFKVVEINTKRSYMVPRTTHDYYTTETSWNSFANGYWKTHASLFYRRVMSVSDGFINKNMKEPLKYKASNGEIFYVGAMVDGFAHPGDVIETKFKNGASLKMLIVDVKSLHDPVGFASQIDSSYGHGKINGSKTSIDLCALEFLTGGSNSTSVSLSGIPGYGSYAVESRIVGHITLAK